MDEPYKSPPVLFDQTKQILPNGVLLTFEYRKGTPIVRVSSTRALSRAVVDPMTDTSGWTAAGSASGLAKDTTNFYDTPASLRFLLTGASTGTLTKTVSTLSISDYEDVGVAFLAIYPPVVPTSITLRLGSSSTAYDEVTVTTGFLDSFTANEWQLIAFDFSGATSTGTPDWTAIDYAQISIAHGATITNFRVGGLWLSLPSPQEILFQSAAVFMASGSNPSTTITDDDDSIILNDAAYVIYEHIAAKTVAMQMSGGKYTAQIKGFDDVLDGTPQKPGLIPIYRGDNPSQELRTVGSYYD